jgi:glycosyltransferase involved in cell wall biosynthesis
MKTIAVVVPDLEEQGGVRTVAAFLLDAIVASKRYKIRLISLATSSTDDCSIRIFSPRSWLNGIQQECRTWDSRTYTHVGALFPEFEFQRYKSRHVLDKLIEGCHLVQVVAGSPAIGNSIINMRIPVVLQVATRAVIERRRKEAEERGLKAAWRRKMSALTDLMDATAIRRADAVMVENKWMEAYCSGIQGSHGQVIYAPPGVCTSKFRPMTRRTLYDASQGYILSVGRLHDERKNVGLLLEAYRQLRMQHALAPKLVLAGATPPCEVFWTRARLLGLLEHIEFISNPSLADLISLYQGATCFALSSDEEGFGMVLIEAMACGIPAVSTRCGGPDGIIEDGVDGFLTPLDDAMSFAERLETLCFDRSLNQKMGLRAREKIVAKYELSVAGSRFINLYDKLLYQPQ